MAAPGPAEPRILSMQSHVVQGYVGNRCAAFTLQAFGLDVGVINTVQFSNHTGYPSKTGTVLGEAALQDLVDGLKANRLADFTHVVTGFVGSAALLCRIASIVKDLRTVNPGLQYVCDPVMGDKGKLYVPAESADVYRNDVVSLASILTPNEFEAAKLTGMEIVTEADALRACRRLQEMGPHTVVITSFTPMTKDDTLLVIATSNLPQDEDSWPSLQIAFPLVQGYFTGTGDLFTALFLVWFLRHPHNLRQAIEKTVSGVHAILLKSADAASHACLAKERTPEVSRSRELRLVQNYALLIDPEVQYHAQELKIE